MSRAVTFLAIGCGVVAGQLAYRIQHRTKP
jgi:hypothetical protein